MPKSFHCERQIFSGRIALYLFSRTFSPQASGETFLGEPVIMSVLRDGCAVMEPTMSLEQESAQQLMDQLWHCGLRPSEGSGSAGSLAATERHLEDMRKLVFEAKA